MDFLSIRKSLIDICYSVLGECLRSSNLSEFNRIASVRKPKNTWKIEPHRLSELHYYMKYICLEDIADAIKRKDNELVKLILPFHEYSAKCVCYKLGCKRENDNNPSFLYLSVTHSDVDLIDILISREKYTKPKRKYRNWKGKHIIIPFHYIAERNPVDEECSRVLDYFLSKGLTIDDKDESTGFSLIHVAAQFGNTEIIPLILKKKGDINAISKKGLTALHVAIIHKNHEFVCRLLSVGADINIQDKRQRTPLCVALISGNRDTIELVMKNVMQNQLTSDHSSHLKSNPLFHYCAAVTGMKDVIETFLMEGEETNLYLMESGKTILHYAAENGHTDIVKLLLQRESTSTAVKKFINHEIGFTPLHYATLRGHEEIVELLLYHDANPELLSEFGETSLHTAVKSGSITIVKMILNSTSNTNILMKPTIKDGYTPLHIAVNNSHDKMVALLLENGACIECKTKTGLLPIHFAVEKSNINILQMLIRKGASLESNDNNGSGIFNYALDKKSNEEMLRFLLLCGVDFSSKNYNNLTPLHRCLLEKEDLNLLQLLLEYGAETNTSWNSLYITRYYPHCDEEPLFHCAIRFKKWEAVNIFLEYDIDINVANSSGEIPFLKYVDHVNYLLENYSHKLIDSDTTYYFNESWVNQKEERHIPFRIIIRSLAKHIGTLEARKCYIHEANLMFIDNSYVKPYYEICQKEIELMKLIKIFKNVTYFDILVGNEYKLELYMCKNEIMQVFSNKEHLELFPQYAVCLDSSVKKGLRRKDLIERSFDLLNKASQFSVPKICSYRIFDYLNSFDLVNFGAAFYLEPPVISLNYVGGKSANSEQ